MADQNLDIVIRFLMDQAAKAKTNQDVKDVADNLKTIKGSFDGDELSKDFAKFQQGFEKTFKRVGEDLIDTRTGLKATAVALREFSKTTQTELEKIAEASKDVTKSNEDMAKSAARSASAQAAIFSGQAQLLNSQVTQIRARSSELTRLSGMIGGVSRTGLAIGVGVVGGIFAAASKYVNDAKEATAVTREWKAAQEDLNKAGERIGAVLAKEALPMLKLAARVAGEAAAFVEKHPEIVQATLNIGVWTAGLSAIGIMVSKGVKFYADQLYLSSVPIQLQAARLQELAADQQLAAAVLNAKAKGIDVLVPAAAGGAAAGGTLGTAGLIVGGVAGLITMNVIVAKQLEILEKTVVDKFGQLARIPIKIIEDSLKFIPGLTLVGPLKNSLLPALDALKKKIEEFKGGEGAAVAPAAEISAERKQALQVYIKYREDDAKLVRDHYADRSKIVSDALKAEQTSNIRYSASVTKINQQRSSSLGEAMRNFTESNVKAEQDYALQRSKIVQDGGKDIQRIEQNLQERLRKMNMDHADRVDDLTRSRDALGLVKEQRAFNRARAEETRQTNLEIRERRVDIAQRLTDLTRQHELERAQRLADYQARVTEINAQAKTQLAELASQHAAELKEIRQNRIDRLREIDAQFADERKRRNQQFIAEIRDIDATLLGEKKLRDQYNALMLSDLDRFLLSYRTKLGTLSGNAFAGATSGAGATATSRVINYPTYSLPGRAGGGYASYGQYLLGDNEGGGRGRPEYILSGRNTELAERVIGGSLTQQSLMSALMFGGGGGARNQIAYNDNRRIDSRISRADRDALVQEAVTAMSEMMRSVR